MSLKIAAITFDCEHAMDLATFWSAALERSIDSSDAETFVQTSLEVPQ